MTLAVKFWGVRGSIACPSPDHVVYGGNTSCLEIFAGDERIIMDAGTGIRNLGQDFIKDGHRIPDLLRHIALSEEFTRATLTQTAAADTAQGSPK